MNTEQTVTRAMPALRDSVDALVSLVESGQILPALHRFYGESVVMQDNTGEPSVGLAANLAREEGFVAYIATVHENRAISVTVDEASQTAAIRWNFEFTGTDGKRLRFDQVALQQWADGKIVREQFFYDSATLAR